MTKTESERQGSKGDKERKRYKEKETEESPRDMVRQTETQPQTETRVDSVAERQGEKALKQKETEKYQKTVI